MPFRCDFACLIDLEAEFYITRFEGAEIISRTFLYSNNSNFDQIKHPRFPSSVFSAHPPPMAPVTVGRHFNLVTLSRVGANYHMKRMGLCRSVPVARSPLSSAASQSCLAMLMWARAPR